MMKSLTFLVSFCILIKHTSFGGLDPSSIRSFFGGEIDAWFAVRIFRGRSSDFTWFQYGNGSIPMKIPFLGEWTSINPSYFDVNYRGTIGFDTLPYVSMHFCRGWSSWSHTFILILCLSIPLKAEILSRTSCQTSMERRSRPLKKPMALTPHVLNWGV